MVKRSKSSRDSREARSAGSLVLVDLTVVERDECNHWIKEHASDLSGFANRVCDAGWKLSVSYSDHYGCYFGSITGKTTGTKYDGSTLSIRHPDCDKLLQVLQFVALVLCPDNRVILPEEFAGDDW